MTIAEYGLLFSGTQALAVVVGFYFAYKQLSLLQYSLRNSVELASRQNAMNLMARYSSVDFAAYRSKLRADKDMQGNYHSMFALLNFFEEIAIAVKHKTANKGILQDAFATSLRSWLEEEYIIEALNRARAKDPARFENLLDLYRDWGGSHSRTVQIRSVEALHAV
ncbi:MAG TPA: hypothetical protein VF173_14110 [Thermoanaerobaculia bacterium]|nr:hypothetical protein [Thermoanaerobaculia bacterium]